MRILNAFEPPALLQPRIATAWLVVLAMLSIGSWRLSEYAAFRRNPPQTLLRAADFMVRATDAIRREKAARGLLRGLELDPNRTGLIGPEWSETTTTLGNLVSKRTLTNPDVAAWVAREFHRAGLRQGDLVAVVLSGSFVGGNIAVLAAAESYPLRTVIVSSLGASMYGAADPALTWIDMEAVVRDAGVWNARSARALLGGESGLARDLGMEPRAALLAAAQRNGIALLEAASFPDLVQNAAAVLGIGPAGGEKPALLVNVGGSQVALGDCREAAGIPAGVVSAAIPCTGGTAGLIQIALAQGVQVLNLFKVKELAARHGLPLDPRPLPEPGRNPFVYAH